MCGALDETLRDAGWRTTVLGTPGQGADALESWDEDELSARVGDDTRIDLVVVSAARAADDWDDAEVRCLHALLVAKHTRRPLLGAAGTGRAAFLAVTRLDGALGHRGATVPTAVLGGVAGLVKTLAMEAPELFCRAVDLAPDLDASTSARLVVDEATDAATDVVEVGHDGTTRHTVTLTDSADRTAEGTDGIAAPGPDDVLVVTGGGRGVTAECAIGLAAAYGSTLLLLGRTNPGDEPEWATGKEGADLKAAITADLRGGGGRVKPADVERVFRAMVSGREVARTVDAVRAAGAEAEYLAVDIADEDATARALAPYADRVTGVVHGAGAVADRAIADKRAEDVRTVFAPKLGGLRSVLAALPSDRLRHLVLFSSVAGFFGNTGQSDYAMANEALNRLARAWKRERGDRRVTAVNWGAWAGGMVTPELAVMFEERGVELIPVETGVRLLVEQFEPRRADDVVTVIAPAGPLAAKPAGSLPEDGRRTERTIADLADEPVLEAHRIGGQIVLPATVALGWCLNTAERLTGRTAVGCRDFRVHGGVVLDAMEDGRLRLDARPTDDDDTIDVTITGTGEQPRPHYAATAVLDGHSTSDDNTNGTPPRIDTLPAGAKKTGAKKTGAKETETDGTDEADGTDGRALYQVGTLFHGPALQGIRRVLQSDCDRMVFECRLPDHEFADGAYAGHRFSPVLADLLLQAPLVAVRRTKDLASLPVGIGRVELYERLPDDEPFLVVVDDIRCDDGTVTSTVTAGTPDGAVLARFVDVTVVPSAELAEKFAAS